MIDLPAVTAAVGAVREPSLRRPLEDLQMLETVEVAADNEVRVAIAVPAPAWPGEVLGRAVAAAAKAVDGVDVVSIDVAVMDEAGREALATSLRAGRAERPGAKARRRG